MLGIVSDAVKDIVKGELVQFQKTRKLDIREEDYFKIIRMKTAALISACTACGRITSYNVCYTKLLRYRFIVEICRCQSVHVMAHVRLEQIMR